MTMEEIQQIIAKDEHRCLELKKTTGELQDGMHTACAFLNTEGGWLIFGVAPKSLKMLGQQEGWLMSAELRGCLSRSMR